MTRMMMINIFNRQIFESLLEHENLSCLITEFNLEKDCNDWKIIYCNGIARSTVNDIDPVLGGFLKSMPEKQVSLFRKEIINLEDKNAVCRRIGVRLNSKWFRATLSKQTDSDKLLITFKPISDIISPEKDLELVESRHSSVVKPTGEISFGHYLKNDLIVWPDDIDHILGYSGSEMGQALKSWLDKVYPDDQSNKKPINVLFIPIKNENGVINVLCVSRDINDRRKTQKAALDYSKLIESVFNAISETLIKIDKKGLIKGINYTGAARLKTTPEELIGKNIYQILPPNAAEFRKKMIDKVFDTGDPIAFDDIRYPIYFSNKIYPVKDEQGNTTDVIVFGLDETEKKRQERDLKIKNHAIESSLIGFAIGDLNGRITYGNAEFEKIWGYSSPREYKGKSYLELFNVPGLPDNLLSLIKKEGKWSGEYLAFRQNGDKFDVEAHASLVISDEGQMLAITISFIDVTEHNKISAEIKEYSEKLKKSNDELKQFAYIASHDLQEPLRGISNSIQIVEKKLSGKLDEDTLKFMNFATEGAKKMQDLINGLMEYSRVENNNKSFDREVDLNKLVERVASMLELKIKENKAEIKINKLPVVRGNESLLYRLFQNLTDNALKFRKSHEKPVIDISSSRIGDNYVIYFEDNGIGIKEEYFEKIFQVFRRLHTSKTIKGTGIGLAICKRIVEAHKGKIGIESKPGSGTKFIITLPIEIQNE
ncbi:MAG: ATP-binding protein [Candidatus Kapaibacterium sp.]